MKKEQHQQSEEHFRQNTVRYYDLEGNEIDALSEEGESLKKEAINIVESEDTSSTSSTVSDVSSKQHMRNQQLEL